MAEQQAAPVTTEDVCFDDEPTSEEGTSRRNDGQLTLLHVPEWWEEHWKGMPEYVQEDFMPYKSITVHFETKEDMERFAAHNSQRLLPTTKSIWWPEAEIAETAKLRWITNPRVEPSKKDELREILEGP